MTVTQNPDLGSQSRESRPDYDVLACADAIKELPSSFWERLPSVPLSHLLGTTVPAGVAGCVRFSGGALDTLIGSIAIVGFGIFIYLAERRAHGRKEEEEP